MNTSWKTIIFYVLDVILAFYLVMAITSWNTPDKKHRICTKVNINISDSNNSGFLSAEEIKAILEKDKLYPLNRQLSSIEPRKIEEALKVGPFVDTAQCYITENGHINIRISQRMPIIRIKNNKGEDYYLDDNGGILPNSKYTSDLIIATGDISKWFAHFAITPMAKAINKSEFWLNQIEQINVRPDRGIELVPRVGNHIIFIGYLPIRRNKAANDKGIDEFVTKKLERTEKFYRYGLSQAGWNKYSYIDVEFDNQIICKRRAAQQTTNEHQQPKQEEKIQTEVSE
ncbi:cell division protein FtsQ/DivIB [Prevotella pallens]|jgi:hypothetical protein|uniref:Cell division protein FtsQ n=2 Tax=Prevotella pallens TaxID=60133 RepID=A0ABX9DR93_9BACT|nr:hypothetical protein [Prevotella pallens]EGQ21321.1 hypothetical protein HMPREF9144_0529 [Prevotella pallens ATCC 700821]MBF1452144.1 cell division protein FtsQ [Prevotella pallens]MBF1458167.1 cell division protein FtsQ [Prevotella pallens]MBF1465508.1 cell division protein FtsQ [Prevotella pallens]MBF1471277.1 cell division protein FtsQ [Prevotella pallens]